MASKKGKTGWAEKEVLAQSFKGKSKEEVIAEFPHLDKEDVGAKYDEVFRTEAPAEAVKKK